MIRKHLNQFSAGSPLSRFVHKMPVVSKVNKDLQDERDKVSFDVSEFTNWYYGGEDNVQEKRFLGKIQSFFKIS